MNINEFIRERKGEWEKLEAIAAKFRPGSSRGLSREELWELGKLYTGAVSDLSLVKSSELGRDPDNDIVRYLSGLVIRVHGMIYRKPPFRWSYVTHFLFQGFPEVFRRTFIYTSLSAGVFILFGAMGFFLGLKEPGFIELLVPEHIISTVEKGRVWFNDLYTLAPLASSRLMTHNISVTFLIVAAGVTFGVGSLYLLALNGLLLGTVGALCARHNLSLAFWSFVLPHGSLELTAIFIAGGAGLILGQALLDPGPYRRTEYLSMRSQEAGRLALGCVPLLVLAGMIEAFFSPSPVPPWLKLLVAVLLFASALTFLLFPRKTASHDGKQVRILHIDYSQ